MRKTATSALLVALLLTATGLSGCGLLGNANAEANDLIGAANAHLNKHQASDDRVRTFSGQFDALGITPADAAKGLTITAQIRAELATQKTELAAAAADIAKIKALDVDETLKKYADLEVAALAAQGAYVDKGVEYYGEMDKLYAAIRDGNASTKVTEDLAVSIERIAGEMKTLSDTSTKAIEAANTYFNKLTD